MDREERLKHSLGLCRERGLAMTVQRRAILKELVSRRDHPSADQIFETVGERIPGLSRTTVYRVLEAFVRAGAARKVSHVFRGLPYFSRKARDSWSWNGLNRKEITVRGLVCMSTSTGMPGTSLTLPSRVSS